MKGADAICKMLDEIGHVKVEYTPTIMDGPVLRCESGQNKWSHSRRALHVEFMSLNGDNITLMRSQSIHAIIEDHETDEQKAQLFKEVVAKFADGTWRPPAPPERTVPTTLAEVKTRVKWITDHVEDSEMCHRYRDELYIDVFHALHHETIDVQDRNEVIALMCGAISGEEYGAWYA